MDEQDFSGHRAFGEAGRARQIALDAAETAGRAAKDAVAARTATISADGNVSHQTSEGAFNAARKADQAAGMAAGAVAKAAAAYEKISEPLIADLAKETAEAAAKAFEAASRATMAYYALGKGWRKNYRLAADTTGARELVEDQGEVDEAEEDGVDLP